jgi:hypothetical protein
LDDRTIIEVLGVACLALGALLVLSSAALHGGFRWQRRRARRLQEQVHDLLDELSRLRQQLGREEQRVDIRDR